MKDLWLIRRFLVQLLMSMDLAKEVESPSCWLDQPWTLAVNECLSGNVALSSRKSHPPAFVALQSQDPWDLAGKQHSLFQTSLEECKQARSNMPSQLQISIQQTAQIASGMISRHELFLYALFSSSTLSHVAHHIQTSVSLASTTWPSNQADVWSRQCTNTSSNQTILNCAWGTSW